MNPIVVHSRDDKEVGEAYEIVWPKTTPRFPKWRWGSIGQVKTGFQIDPKYFQKVATEFLKSFISTDWQLTKWLTYCLDTHNAKAVGFIFPLLNVNLLQYIPCDGLLSITGIVCIFYSDFFDYTDMLIKKFLICCTAV